MNEHFLHLYNEELAALRHKAVRFADTYPKIAGRLRLSAHIADDPQTERLLQSFAFSAARIRLKLHDEFPELTNELLEILYPHFLTTIPSMTMVQFQPDPKLDSIQTIPRCTEIISEQIDNDICRFRTTQQVEIAPIKIEALALSGHPVVAPSSPFTDTVGCLHISLQTLDKKKTFQDIGLKKIRFYLSASWSHAVALYELLGNNISGIALARHAFDKAPVFLDKTSFHLSGFETDESILPFTATSFTGYRLLAEFFTFPQKFLFFDIEDICSSFSEQMDIFIYLKSSDKTLEKSISTDYLRLHVTPVINLFEQACEPVQIDGTHNEYRLVPDTRRHNTREVLSVEKVHVTDQNGHIAACQPFFRSSQCEKTSDIFWQSKRHISDADQINNTELSFVDWNRQPLDVPHMIASVDALCSNGNLPQKLPFGGGQPRLNSVSSFSTTTIKALMPPTQPLRRTEHTEREWCLISHLLLNHTSLSDGNGSALKEILQLYIMRDMPDRRGLVDAITGVEAKNSTACLKNGAVLYGTDITIEFSPEHADKASVFLFGNILERFLGLYTSINSYTRLTVKLHGFSQPVASWPPRAAERALI